MGLARLFGNGQLPLGMDIDDRIVLADVTRTRLATRCNGVAIIEPAPTEVRPQDMALDEHVRAFAEPLRAYIHAHHLSGRRVAIAPPSDSVIVRQLSMPPLPKRVLRHAVTAEIGKRILLPFDDPLLDYAIVPAGSMAPVAERRGQQNILVVAASKAMVWPWVELARHVGLKPRIVEPGLFGAVRLLQAELQRDAVSLVVVIGRGGFDVGLTQGGVPTYVRFVSLRPADYGPPDNWDVHGYTLDVSAEIDRSISFMNFNVLGGSARIENIVLVDRVGCTEQLVAAVQSRTDLPIGVPPMPYDLAAKEGHTPSAAANAAHHTATGAIAVGVALPEVAS